MGANNHLLRLDIITPRGNNKWGVIIACYTVNLTGCSGKCWFLTIFLGRFPFITSASPHKWCQLHSYFCPSRISLSTTVIPLTSLIPSYLSDHYFFDQPLRRSPPTPMTVSSFFSFSQRKGISCYTQLGTPKLPL